MADVEVDVLIAGGGLVGAAAALGLARQGWRTGLIDRAEPARVKGRLGFDPRTVALNPASQHLLAGLGVWGRFETCAFSRVYVWEERGTRHIEFSAEEVGRAELGFISEVSALVTALWESIKRDERITVFTQHDIQTVDATGYGVSVRTGAQSVSARLLVAADGGHSAVRRLLATPMAQLETDHVALATVVETERFHEHTAAQRFLEKGPLALLPLPSREGRHYCSVVWSSIASRTTALAALPERAFAEALEAASERRLGTIIDVDRRQTFPLEQTLVASFHPQPRVLLVGDAAHVLHPLAGQGVNLGFEDVNELLRVATRLTGSDPGAPDVWRRFAAERRIHAEVTIRAMDAFRRVYAVDQPVFRWLRNVGVEVLGHAPVVKTELIRRALGL